MDPNCPICVGEGWVCVQHPDIPFGNCECGAEGKACVCNPEHRIPLIERFISNDWRDQMH